jgi:hypothetical protein
VTSKEKNRLGGGGRNSFSRNVTGLEVPDPPFSSRVPAAESLLKASSHHFLTPVPAETNPRILTMTHSTTPGSRLANPLLNSLSNCFSVPKWTFGATGRYAVAQGAKRVQWNPCQPGHEKSREVEMDAPAVPHGTVVRKTIAHIDRAELY